MRIKKGIPVPGTDLKLFVTWILSIFILVSAAPNPPSTAILLNANKVNVKRVSVHPYRVINKRRSQFYDLPSRNDYYYDRSEPEFSDSDAFHMEADDAVVDLKYSPPLVEPQPKHPLTLGNFPVANIPMSMHPSYRDHMPTFHPTSVWKPTVEYDHSFKSSTRYPITKGYKHMDPVVVEATVTSDYKINGDNKDPLLLGDDPTKYNKPSSSVVNPHLLRNNFTDINSSQVPVPSDAIYKFQRPPHNLNITNNDEKSLNNKHLPNQSRSVPTTTQVQYSLSDNNTVVPIVESETLLKDNRDSPTYVGTHLPDILVNVTTAITIITTKGMIDFVENDTMSTPKSFDVKENISDPVLPVGSSRSDKLSSGAVAGIVIAILSGVTVLTSSVIYLLYRRCNGKCTSVVESKFNSDNCGYLDDSLRSSVYLNNHIELPKENSEEMTSLDNDSFLNSLETMTIQNYWADNTKNTKV